MNPELEQVNALAVGLEGRRIGLLNRLAGDRHLFAFDQEYVDDAKRPTLSLAYKGQSGGLVTAVRAVGRRLPPFFSNLLPEGRLREYLAGKAGVKPEREFFLIATLGADLPGAVTVTTMDEEYQGGRGRQLGGRIRDRAPQGETGALRFSLAGVQLKFSAMLETSGGLTIPGDGVGGSWIVKLPSPQYAAVPENEYVMLELARAVGIAVPALRLVPVSEIDGLPKDAARMDARALAVERFDRAAGGRRIHMEDLAQVFGLFPEDKYRQRSYANIAAVLWAETGDADTYEFARRVVFSVLIGNGDMHLKSWSLLYPDGRSPALSPAYDFVSTLPYLPGDSLALSFGGGRSLEGVTLDQVRRFAERARLPVKPLWDVARETAGRTEECWKNLPQKELLPPDLFQKIDDQIRRAVSGTLGQ